MASLDHIALSTIHQLAACHGEQPLMELVYDFETGATTEHELGEGGDRTATGKHLEGIIHGLAGLFPEDGNQQKAILAGVARGLAYRALSAIERAERATVSMDGLCGHRAPPPEAKARPVVAYSVGADLRDLGYDPNKLTALIGSEVMAMRICSAKARADAAWYTAGSLAQMYQDAESVLARMGIDVLPPRQQGSHFQTMARQIAGLDRKD